MDAGLKRELGEKVRSGERLTHEDGRALYAADDLAWLGGLAHEVRTRHHGDRVHFAATRHLDTTVVAASRRAGELAGEGLTELYLTSGPDPDPDLPWDERVRSLRELTAALPDVSLHAFTATGIQHAETLSGRPAAQLLDELIDAGLASLTGGAGTLGWADWSRIQRLAHAKGLKTPCTVLHGETEDPGHKVAQALRLRELQDETGGFQTVVPLPAPLSGARTATPLETLKTFAVSRLLLDNVPHLKVRLPMYGVQTAQLALQHGADDIDAAPGAGGSPAEPPLTREDLLDLIRDAGFRPAERTARYTLVQEYEGPDPARREAPQPMRL
ncbi:radical SAM protein [Streptomyces sp. NPDC056716]|uniref:radical SAM protein n=1 Tax=unclassified Streptomyces TaxID=2593676 RepID=UPI0036A975E4